MKKRGQSSTITIVLIIILILVAIAIVIFYVRKMMEDNTSFDGDKFDVELKIERAWRTASGDNLYVTLSRKGQGNLSSMKFLLKDSSDAMFTYTYSYSDLILKDLETKTYAMDCSKIAGLSTLAEGVCDNTGDAFVSMKSVAVAYGRKITARKEVFSDLSEVFILGDEPPLEEIYNPMYMPVSCVGASQPCMPSETIGECMTYTAACDEATGEFGVDCVENIALDGTPCEGGACLVGTCAPTSCVEWETTECATGGNPCKDYILTCNGGSYAGSFCEEAGTNKRDGTPCLETGTCQEGVCVGGSGPILMHLSGCDILNVPSGNYILDRDIDVQEDGPNSNGFGNCFDIEEKDITFDLDGHTVNGVGIARGISINPGVTGASVSNGKITNFDYGIKISGDECEASELSFEDNTKGLEISGSNCEASELNLEDNTNGFTLSGQDVILRDSTITRSGGSGVNLGVSTLSRLNFIDSSFVCSYSDPTKYPKVSIIDTTFDAPTRFPWGGILSFARCGEIIINNVEVTGNFQAGVNAVSFQDGSSENINGLVSCDAGVSCSWNSALHGTGNFFLSSFDCPDAQFSPCP